MNPLPTTYLVVPVDALVESLLQEDYCNADLDVAFHTAGPSAKVIQRCVAAAKEQLS